jgi:hypothetical protein
MSVRVMSRVWEHSRATGGELLVALALADFANDSGESYPSVPILAKKARLTERQVQRVLIALESLGEVRRIRSNGGRNRRNRYFVTLPENPDKITMKQLQGKNNTVICDTETVTFATKNGDTSVTRKEPSKNRQRTINKRAAKTSFPENFEISLSLKEWAAGKKLPSPETEFDKFRNYHVAKGSTFADWTAALRNWLLRANEFAIRNGTSTRVVGPMGKYAHLG